MAVMWVNIVNWLNYACKFSDPESTSIANIAFHFICIFVRDLKMKMSNYIRWRKHRTSHNSALIYCFPAEACIQVYEPFQKVSPLTISPILIMRNCQRLAFLEGVINRRGGSRLLRYLQLHINYSYKVLQWIKNSKLLRTKYIHRCHIIRTRASSSVLSHFEQMFCHETNTF